MKRTKRASSTAGFPKDQDIKQKPSTKREKDKSHSEASATFSKDQDAKQKSSASAKKIKPRSHSEASAFAKPRPKTAAEIQQKNETLFEFGRFRFFASKPIVMPGYCQPSFSNVRNLKKTYSQEKMTEVTFQIYQGNTKDFLAKMQDCQGNEEESTVPKELKIGVVLKRGQHDIKATHNVFFQAVLFSLQPVLTTAKKPLKGEAADAETVKQWKDNMSSAVQSIINADPRFATNPTYCQGYCPGYTELGLCDIAEVAALYGHVDFLKFLNSKGLLDRRSFSVFYRAGPHGGHVNVLKYLVEDCKLNPNTEAPFLASSPAYQGRFRFPISALVVAAAIVTSQKEVKPETTQRYKDAINYLLPRTNPLLPLEEANMHPPTVNRYLDYLKDNFPVINLPRLIQTRMSELSSSNPKRALLQAAYDHLSPPKAEGSQEATQPLEDEAAQLAAVSTSVPEAKAEPTRNDSSYASCLAQSGSPYVAKKKRDRDDDGADHAARPGGNKQHLSSTSAHRPGAK